jgi:transmembrane sensor
MLDHAIRAVPQPFNEAFYGQMDDLIIRSFQNELSEIEERRLQNWRSDSPENEERYQHLVQLWGLALRPRPAGVVPPRPSSALVIQEAERRRAIRPPSRRLSWPAAGGWVRRGAAVAAGVVLMAGIIRMLPGRHEADHLGAAEFVTGAKETATVALTDGTVVRLAPNSRLSLQNTARGRGVWLEGRAYFAVESDSTRPFTVRTRAGDAIVLGTRFELRTDGEDLRLVVVEGRVALDAGGEKVEVGADEVSHIRDGGDPSVVRVDNVLDLLDWPDGLLIFRSTPLEQVGLELGRRFNVHVELADPEIAGRRVSGWFTDESLDEVLTAICRASNVSCTLEESSVRITDRLSDRG